MSTITITKKHNLEDKDIILFFDNVLNKLKENFEFDRIDEIESKEGYKILFSNKHVKGEFINKDNDLIINITLLTFMSKMFKKEISNKIEETLLKELDNNKKE